MSADLIHRRTAWTCFAPTTKVSRCEHLNAASNRARRRRNKSTEPGESNREPSV